jgi:succinoglycan biosynthesis transport protein ExoP
MRHSDDTFSAPDRIAPGNAPFISEFIDLPRLANLIRAKLWIIAAIAGAIFLAAVVYVLRSPEIYESRAVLQVSQEAQKVTKIEDVAGERPESGDYLHTVVEGFTSRKLMLRVIRALGLENDPKFAPPNEDGSRYTEIELADLMSAKLAVSLRRNTRVINVITFDEDPEMARKLAETFVQEFLHETYEQRRSAARVAHQFLREESRQLKTQLEEAERKLQAYKESNKAVSLVERQDIVVEQLREINTKATEAKSIRLRLEADLEQIKRINPSDTEQLLQIESVAQLPQVAMIRERLLKAENDLAAIAKRNLPMHPRFVTAQTRIANLNATLKETLSKASNMVAKQYDAASEGEAKLQKSLKEQEQKAMELNRIAIPYNVLQRDVESDRALYESVTLRLKETYVTEGIDNAPFRVIEEPLVASSPSKPRKKLILALALAFGIVVGVGAVTGRDAIDGSLRTVDEAESYLQLPILASIPERRDTAGLTSSKKSDGNSLVLVDSPVSPEAEAFRTLRTSISLLGKESEFRSFLFTSALPSEGKTFVAVNFALSLAQQGLETVIIDADLREPRVEKALRSEGDNAGLTDLLSEQIDLQDAVKATQHDNLIILPAGRRAPDPAKLLCNKHFESIVENLLREFDRVVIDSPPVNAVSDALLVAASAHATCLVVRAGKTPKRAIRRAINQLHVAQASLAGFVFNRLPIQGRSAGYYYYYYGERYARAGEPRGSKGSTAGEVVKG